MFFLMLFTGKEKAAIDAPSQQYSTKLKPNSKLELERID